MRAHKAVNRPTKFSMQSTDMQMRDPNLVYLEPDATYGIPSKEFYDSKVFMSGFDAKGNPISNRRRKKNNRMDNLIQAMAKKG